MTSLSCSYACRNTNCIFWWLLAKMELLKRSINPDKDLLKSSDSDNGDNYFFLKQIFISKFAYSAYRNKFFVNPILILQRKVAIFKGLMIYFCKLDKMFFHINYILRILHAIQLPSPLVIIPKGSCKLISVQVVLNAMRLALN